MSEEQIAKLTDTEIKELLILIGFETSRRTRARQQEANRLFVQSLETKP